MVEGTINQGILAVDMLGRIVFFNAEIVRMLGPQTLYENPEGRRKTEGFFLPDQKTPWPVEELPLQRIIHGGDISGGLMFVKNNQVPEGMWIMNYAYPLRKGNTLVGAVALLKEIVEASSKGLPSLGSNIPMLPM
jgi:sensor histidine kinase regulating citrate/malate metabolism